MALVTCARVGDALIKWLKVASELKKDELCEALGCQGATDEEIAAVFLTCDGVAHIPGTSIPTCEEMETAIDEAIAAIFTGGTADQVWTKRADGTQGWEDSLSSISTLDTDTVALTGEGSVGVPLQADVILSPNSNNALAAVSPATGLPASAPGVFSHATNLSWNNVDKTITYVNNKGATVTIDLSQFEVDLHVDNATFDPATTLLTLNVAGGTPVQVDLGALAAISTDSTATATLIGDGTVAAPLQVVVNVDPVAGNKLLASAAGLRVEAELPPSVEADDGKVLTVDEDGNPVWTTPEAGGDVCAQFEDMDEITTPVLPFKVIIQDADENCGYINMNNPNFYVDVRTDTKTTITQAVEDDVTTISFTVRNVGMTDINDLSLVATIPAVTTGSPEFTVGPLSVTNPGNAVYNQTVDTATNKTFEFGTLAAGSTVTFSYPVTLLTKGTYVFASDLVLPAGVIDYSLVDNHSTVSVGVREQQPEQPDPISCPAMNVTVSVNGGPELIPTLVEVPSGSINFITLGAANPRSILLVPTEYGGPEVSVVIKTQVPVTLSPYLGPITRSGVLGQWEYGGQLYTKGSERGGMASNPLTQTPSNNVDVDTNPNNQEFTLRYTPPISYTTANDGQGATVAVALRPSADCIFQQFGIVFVQPRPEGLLTITGDAPSYTKATEYAPALNSTITYMDGSVGSARAANNANVIAEERAYFTIPAGTGYSFKVVSTAPGNLGSTPVTGNIAINVISNSEWDVTISPLATAADNQVIGRLHFNIV